MTPTRSNAASALVPPVAQISSEESEFVARARGGDREAFGWLVERHQDRVYGLAFRLCKGDRDRAEELAQEAFLRALKGLQAFRGEAAFSTWMHRIVLNLHSNEASTLASHARRRQLSLSSSRHDDEAPHLEVAAPSRRPEELVAEAELIERMRAAFDDLDEPRRIAVLLRDVEGRSYEEIAELLDVPIGTVRSRLARAREELSKKLGGTGFRPGPE